MTGNKRVIGICIAKVQSVAATEYLSRLHRYARELGYKLIIFNSPADFYNNDSSDIGAKSVFKLINYDIIDAIIIHADEFRSETVLKELISDISEHNVPTVLIKARDERCYCIINDYESSLKRMIEHVICDHGVTDTCFIAGRREEDEESKRRISCYKEVLEANGLPFSDELVEYGEYWDIPTFQAMKRIIDKRGEPPKAIFCANDYMAMAVCNDLMQRGYRVPEDVIVTGFDGVPEAVYRIPQLTTCKEDFDALAEKTIRLLERIFGGEDAPEISYNEYSEFLTESCGCPYRGSEPRLEAQKQYSMVHDSLSHDDFIFGWLSTALEATDLTSFMSLIPNLVLSLGYVCLNSDYTIQITGGKQEQRDFTFTDKMEIVNSIYSPDPPEYKSFDRSDMIPSLENWTAEQNDSICVISSISSGATVFGYYVVRTGNIYTDAHSINRSLNALNIAFNSIVAYYQQRIMLLGLKNAALTDHLTGLPNLKGTTEWFEEFSADPKNHELCLTFSVYGLPKYKYIYENYGIKEIEEAIRFVAKSLKESNEATAFIGHVADDEFLVINRYDSADQIAGVIDSATSKFFSTIGRYNAEQKKDYYLDVNAGCADLYPGWRGTLASFSKLAGNAMYLNRMNRNYEPKVSSTKVPADVYKSFEVLIEKNMFGYHFQPIVSARTGEILAYEALMRPDKTINMNPDEVIQTAVEYDRLDDIERATMFNVLGVYSERHECFKGRKIFINSIPGHFLHGKDYEKLLSRFGNYLGHIVIEITEGSTVSDEELKLIRGLGSVPIAIDDYGTGHSNIVNLLRYSPQIIKIDRFLVSEIHKDTNKQLFFRSTVEFAGMNGIKVLAEGVETSEELCCVIDLGADLIQGYYTGRPVPEPLEEIDPDIKKMILERQ